MCGADLCVCSLAAAAGLLSGGTLRDVERNGERRGDHVQRGGVRSPRYAAAALCVVCDGGVVVVAAAISSSLLERNVTFPPDHFRGLHRLLWSAEER